MSSKKGQIWSTDFLISAVVITFIALMFILIWNGLAVRWNNAQEYRQMYVDAAFAADALLTTPGDPESWENLETIDEDTVHALGIVNSRNEINNMKMEKLVGLNDTEYAMVRQKLGITKYDVEIKVTDLSQDSLYYYFGRTSTMLETSIVLERMALLNNTPVIVSIEVWK